MGDCYSVGLKIKANDNFVKVFNDFINSTSNRTNWNIDKYEKDGVSPTSVEGLARILLASWKEQQANVASLDNGWMYITNDFDASYGWCGVMQDVFINLCENDSVEDKSYIEIWSDDAGNFRIYKDESSPTKFRYEDIK